MDGILSFLTYNKGGAKKNFKSSMDGILKALFNEFKFILKILQQ